jgi:hypothetical protein
MAGTRARRTRRHARRVIAAKAAEISRVRAWTIAPKARVRAASPLQQLFGGVFDPGLENGHPGTWRLLSTSNPSTSR